MIFIFQLEFGIACQTRLCTALSFILDEYIIISFFFLIIMLCEFGGAWDCLGNIKLVVSETVAGNATHFWKFTKR